MPLSGEISDSTSRRLRSQQKPWYHLTTSYHRKDKGIELTRLGRAEHRITSTFVKESRDIEHQARSVGQVLQNRRVKLRNRLRYCIWHDWKKPQRKRKNLITLWIKIEQAFAWSRTRIGGWAAAQSPILKTTITIPRQKERGYESMQDYYQNVQVWFSEPPCTRTVCTVVGEAHGGLMAPGPSTRFCCVYLLKIAFTVVCIW